MAALTGKRITMEQRFMDRLSELHDSIIITHILSLLEMKDAVRTGILSKRWNKLWTQVHNIDYQCHLVPTGLLFIDNTLLQCVSNIRKFSMSGFTFCNQPQFRGIGTFNKLIDKWMEYICKKEVEIMNLNTLGLGMEYYRLPGFLFRYSLLTQLELSSMRIILSTPANWCMLRSLSLDSIHMPRGALDNILSGCPVLETLVLVKVLLPIRIMSSSLKKLKLVDTCHYCDINNGLEIIRAPLLQELEIRRSFSDVKNHVIADVPSLVKGILDFGICDTRRNKGFFNQEQWFHMVVELVKSLCQVGELVIGSQLLQPLSLSSLVGKPCPTFMCKHLEINSPLWKYDIPGLVHLLERMPHLETLVINVSSELVPEPFDLTQNQSFPEPSFQSGSLIHLKKVIIDYHRNPYNDDDSIDKIGLRCVDFELIGYIMRSCVALEKLVICSTKPYCCNNAECRNSCCVFRYLPQFSGRLVEEVLPANSQWEVKKSDFTFEYSFLN